ncbi:MAG: TPM domain-containing protein [Oscillospiraceae bacterium]|nr:TPM domain-containing protein [Oscillospiraceae bacterium]MBR2890698.1 TPM domain-containing protein [Oscillospiraceae bacterium]
MKRQLLKITLILLLILSLTFSVFATGEWRNDAHILDRANLLTQEENEALNTLASQISNEYSCGIYIMTVPDFTAYGFGYDIFEAAWRTYHDNELGYGPGRDGMILMLSMADRDYAMFFYGQAEYAFNDYGQEQLETVFLDNFRNDDWFGGFLDYLETSEEYLSLAAQGDPVRESPMEMAGIFIFIAVIISAVVTGIFWAQMRNVHSKREASHYITDGGLKLKGRTDLFLRRSRVVRKIPKQTSSGSSGSRSGGGGSGRSGKF